MHRRFNNSLYSKQLQDPPGVYRFSTIGKALRMTLDELKCAGKISPFLESHILKVFDTKMTTALEKFAQDDVTKREIWTPTVTITAQATLRNHFLDGAWEFIFQDVVVKPCSNSTVAVKTLKVLAHNYSDKSAENYKLIKSLAK